MGSLITTSSPTLIAACPVTATLLTKTSENGQYSIQMDMQSRTEQLTYLVAWKDRGAFINFVAGYTTGGVRHQPLTDPFCTYLYCTGISGKAIGADKQTSTTRPWPFIVFTLTFSTLPLDPNGASPYFTVRYRGSTSVATVPGAKLQFATGEYIDHDYGILLGQYGIEITLFQVAAINTFLMTYDPLKGKVNSDTVTILGFAYSPGYLLLNTVDAEMQVNSLGAPQNQGTVSLIARSIPWNSDIDSNGTVQAVTPAPYLTTAFAGAFS